MIDTAAVVVVVNHSLVDDDLFVQFHHYLLHVSNVFVHDDDMIVMIEK
jgi:hypothetical protein